MARFTLGLLFAIRLLTPGPAGAQGLSAAVGETDGASVQEVQEEAAGMGRGDPEAPLVIIEPEALADVAEPEGSVDVAEVELQVAVAEPEGPVATAKPELQVVSAPVAMDVPGMITDAARRWGLDRAQMLRVAWCESKFNPRAYNGRSGAAGLYQFLPGTWSRASAAVGMAYASPFDPIANVEAAAWLMKTEGPRHWTCR
jgi:hypothetical protein